MTISPSPMARSRAPLPALAALLCTVAAGWLAGTAGARAQAPELQLAWNAPAECPPKRDLLLAVERSLGRPTLGTAARSVAVVAHVVPEGALYALRLRSEADGRTDVRELHAASCDELVQATALIVALAIDPDAAEARTPKAAPDGPEDPPGASPPEDPPAPAEKRAAAPALEGLVSLGLAFDSHTLPSATVGPVASVGLARNWLELEAGVLWLPPRKAAEAGRSARVQVAAATLRLCARLFEGAIALSLCGDAEAGRLVARGDQSLDSPTRGEGPWAALGGGLRARARFTEHWGLSLAAGVLGALTRPRILVASGPSVPSPRVLHRPGPATARVDLRGEVRF